VVGRVGRAAAAGGETHMTTDIPIEIEAGLADSFLVYYG
jgi:hypothetical protein